MESEESFFEAMRAVPDDDTPRLIFADWLEEQGDPRAELFRLSVEVARVPSGDPHFTTLQARMNAVRRRTEAAWLGPLQGHVDGWKVERGLLHLLGAPDELAKVVPQARAVLRWVEGLQLSGRAHTCEWLLSSMECPHLRVLNLSWSRLGIGISRILRCSSILSQLHTLNLTSNDIDERGLDHLANCPSLQRLRALYLGFNRIGPCGAGFFIRGAFPALEVLDLNNNQLAVEGFRTLVRGLALPHLESLALGANGIDGCDAFQLAHSTQFGQLRELHLDGNEIGDAGAQALAASPYLGSLRVLDLEGNSIRASGARALLTSANLANVSRFNLQNNPIGPSQARALKAEFGDRVEL